MSWMQQKRYEKLLAGERGTRRKIWNDQLTVCLAYPNVYRIGMSNLGFQTVYGLLNRLPGCLCERIFLPDPTEGDASRQEALVSMESQRPLKEFDILAFALPFENDYPYVLRMLEQAGIPMEAGSRDDSDPLIMAGGIAVTLNPEPLSSFVDLFLLGEAEELLPEFVERYDNVLRQGKKRGGPFICRST